MAYQYLDEVTSADLAFEARGNTPEELFRSAADATINAMVIEIDDIEPKVRREARFTGEGIGDLLYAFLQKIVYYKDAEALVLRVTELRFKEGALDAVFEGEPIDPNKHELGTDVKGVTLHRFSVVQEGRGWMATVVLDI